MKMLNRASNERFKSGSCCPGVEACHKLPVVRSVAVRLGD